jgi:hypothetical protein
VHHLVSGGREGEQCIRVRVNTSRCLRVQGSQGTAHCSAVRATVGFAKLTSTFQQFSCLGFSSPSLPWGTRHTDQMTYYLLRSNSTHAMHEKKFSMHICSPMRARGSLRPLPLLPQHAASSLCCRYASIAWHAMSTSLSHAR